MSEQIMSKQQDANTHTDIFKAPEMSNWKCYMFGCYSHSIGFVYTPVKGAVPNRFVRWMMKVCFDCLWVKDKP